jgi:hypothetical protein
LEDALHRFHTIKDIVLLGRACKSPTAEANTQRKQLLKKRKVDEETNGDTSMPSQEWHERNAWRDNISHKIDVSKELDTNFTFLKIQMMFHSHKPIGKYRTFQQ